VLSVGCEDREGDVDIGTAERSFPVLRAAVPDVSETRGTRRHASTELRREAVE
jgi:hypothetical protein